VIGAGGEPAAAGAECPAAGTSSRPSPASRIRARFIWCVSEIRGEIRPRLFRNSLALRFPGEARRGHRSAAHAARTAAYHAGSVEPACIAACTRIAKTLLPILAAVSTPFRVSPKPSNPPPQAVAEEKGGETSPGVLGRYPCAATIWRWARWITNRTKPMDQCYVALQQRNAARPSVQPGTESGTEFGGKGPKSWKTWNPNPSKTP